MIKHLLSLFVSIIPNRFFTFKSKIWNHIGYNIHYSARLSSSVKLLGSIDIMIKDDTFIGHNTLIMGGESKITIGKNCDISSNVTIVSGTHELNPRGIRMAGRGIGKDVIIRNGVWVGASVTILPGVTIGEMSVVAAGSIVNKNVDSYTMVAGNPAKPIKRFNLINSEWEICKK